MDEETGFLRALLANPADDTTRMVYADWLDERGGAESKDKAHFLRVTVRLMGSIRRAGWRSARQRELHQLAQTLPTEWLAAVSRLKVEACAAAREKQNAAELWEKYGIRFNVVCEKRWDELTATADAGVRHCDACGRSVHYCDTLDTARTHARLGDCVAVSLGVVRHGYDLELPTMMLGAPGVL